MGELFLSGGGNAKQTYVIDTHFVRNIRKDKPLLYIPIAMDASRFDDCLTWIQNVFNPLGIQEIVMWKDVKNKNIKDLQQFSAIYIGGGNTFRLLKEFMDTKFTEVIKEYVAAGGIVYGGSAGAIILGEHIMTCGHMDENDVNLHTYTGLQLVNGYAIWCHYNEGNDLLIQNYMKKYETPVICLPEETAVIVNDSVIKVIGDKYAYTFRDGGKTIFHPGNVIT
ncbi:peptidase [Bacillus manliponensis]|uniref:Peptidase n=1 Tax=Bacillus manliponensis TaxID=574376 RepID=A0A073JWR1_9BACI|nr:Type 1 glutamine amidotransferase-like domain-containing protein [Bacillus manliponensis]KEK18657.1 peptidase [Bacillus manliponensis]